MGLVFIKHPDVEVLGECLEEKVPFWEAHGWAQYNPDTPLPDPSALKAAWVEAAQRKGMPEEQIDGMTKAQIITHLAEAPEPHPADPDMTGDAPNTDEEPI